MRIGAAISVLVHVVFVAITLVLGEASLFHHIAAEAITVDIVSAKDAPAQKLDLNFPTLSDKPTDDSKSNAEKAADSKPPETKAEAKPSETKPPETKPAEIKPPETKPAEKKQQLAAQSPPQASPSTPAPAPPPPPPPPPPAEVSPPQAAPIPYTDLSQKFSKLVGEGDSDFDAPADNAANISLDSAKALREKLKECSILPKSVAPSDDVKIVLRVALLRNGKLARDPLLIQASASEKGPALLKSATTALLACQPFGFLPADKYDEWKVLDLSFTPKDFKRG